MKNDDEYHHDISHIDALPRAIPTGFMYAGLTAGLNGIAARAGESGMWKIAKQMRAQIKGLLNLERINLEKWLRLKLSRDARFRADVLGELGGERALRRWERRAGAGGWPEPAPSRRHQGTRAAARRTRTVSGPKTDRSGMFRLAPITYSDNAARSRSSGSRPGATRLRPLCTDFRPIALRPHELRGYGGEAMAGADDGHTDHNTDITPNALWALMLEPVLAASDRLDAIEMAMTLAQTGRAACASGIGEAPAASAEDNRPARGVLFPT